MVSIPACHTGEPGSRMIFNVGVASEIEQTNVYKISEKVRTIASDNQRPISMFMSLERFRT